MTWGDAMDLKDDINRMPRNAGIIGAIGVLVAATLWCAVAMLQGDNCVPILCSPLFVGAIVGLFSDHPISNAILIFTAALACSLIVWGVGLLWFGGVLPPALIVLIVGATCGSTIQRFICGRRARANLTAHLASRSAAQDPRL